MTESSAEKIFHVARSMELTNRPEYLLGACGGDGALRSAVDRLLAADEVADGFLEPPIQDSSVESYGPSTMVGRYKLLQRIGEGGFGEVWMAEQSEPVRRRVALKLVKAGMDTRRLISRFEAERQALAMMNHPNIAQVLDAGATDRGRPYFVMELVPGVSITEFCDRENFSIRERLDVFRDVCMAVQHAHQKGIIHRDIKPSNVLVSMADGRPTPKVIDFGIAKATQGTLTDRTLFTEFRQLMGTPAYMSPEQAEMTSGDIDTRSDVYSLGVLLYELMTGTTPFTTDELMAAGIGEIHRVIRERVPTKPSTMLSTMDELGSVAAHRRAEPGRLGTLVRGELDWIIMTCLEKDRSRRYGGVDGLAEDIRRHLEGEAVAAAPPTRRYRIAKFVARHRVAVSSISLVAISMLLGTVGTAAGFLSARKERGRVLDHVASASQAIQDSAQILIDAYDQLGDGKPRVVPTVDPSIYDEMEVEALGISARNLAISLANHLKDEKTRRDSSLRNLQELEAILEFHADRFRGVECVAIGENLRRSIPEFFPEDERADVEKALAVPAFGSAVSEALLVGVFDPTMERLEERFHQRPLARAWLYQELATTLRRLGHLDSAVAPQANALSIRMNLLGAKHTRTIESMAEQDLLDRLVHQSEAQESSGTDSNDQG